MRAMLRAAPSRQLQAQVASFAFARRRAEAVHLASWGLAIGGLVAGLIEIGFQFFAFDVGPVVSVSLALAMAIAAAVAGWLRAAPDLRVALEIDRRLDLGERVTTALEMVRVRPGHPLAEQQIVDALAHLRRVHPSAVYPLRLSRRVHVLVAVGIGLMILPLVVSLPSLPGVHSPASRVSEVAHAEATHLDAVANNLEGQKNSLDQPTRAALAAQLRRAADDLRRDSTNSQQATQDLLRAEQAASTLAPQTGEDAALTLARISDALNNQAVTRPVTQALDQQNVAQAVAALNQLAASLPNMTPQQRNDLAQALQAASNAARGSDTSAAQQLQQAAQAAKNGDAQGVQQAAQALQQLGAASQAQRDVAQARSELQSSEQAVAQAGQTGLPQISPASSQSGTATGGQPSDQGSGQTSGRGQSDQGNQQANQQGGGIGKGSTDHLGAPQDFQDLAQREVTVPTDQQFDATSIGASSQLQAGTSGEARVDYRNVLPQYQKQALQAIDGNAVPTGLKQVVKGYFDSLAAP